MSGYGDLAPFLLSLNWGYPNDYVDVELVEEGEVPCWNGHHWLCETWRSCVALCGIAGEDHPGFRYRVEPSFFVVSLDEACGSTRNFRGLEEHWEPPEPTCEALDERNWSRKLIGFLRLRFCEDRIVEW